GCIDHGTLVGPENIDECGSRDNYSAHIDVHLHHQSSEISRRRFKVFVKHDARIVHQHVELGEIRFHTRCEGGYLRRVRDIALDRMQFRVPRLHLIKHSLTPTSDDDFIAQFEELQSESQPDTG